MTDDDVYPDVSWPVSNHEVLEQVRETSELEERLAAAHRRAGSAMRQLGEQIVRSGNLEAKLGITIAERIVAQRKNR